MLAPSTISTDVLKYVAASRAASAQPMTAIFAPDSLNTIIPMKTTIRGSSASPTVNADAMERGKISWDKKFGVLYPGFRKH